MSTNKLRRNFAIFGVVAVIGLVGLFLALPSNSDDATAGTKTTGQLEFSEEDWDFGNISMRDGNVVKEIVVTNSSENPITVTRMETSCMCTKVQIVHEDGEKSPLKGMVGHGGSPYVTEVIQPNETATLKVVFDPNAHGPNGTGYISRTVTLQTDSKDQAEKQLTFSGNVLK